MFLDRGVWNPKIHVLGTFCDVPDNKVAICYTYYMAPQIKKFTKFSGWGGGGGGVLARSAMRIIVLCAQ